MAQGDQASTPVRGQALESLPTRRPDVAIRASLCVNSRLLWDFLVPVRGYAQGWSVAFTGIAA